jgi:hypothetical protein
MTIGLSNHANIMGAIHTLSYKVDLKNENHNSRQQWGKAPQKKTSQTTIAWLNYETNKLVLGARLNKDLTYSAQFGNMKAWNSKYKEVDGFKSFFYSRPMIHPLRLW